jgi:hypothetical protein
MGSVTVAQHLHAVIAFFNDNNGTCGIERDTNVKVELAGACSFAAYGAEMRAVAVAQNLNTMVAIVGNNKVAAACCLLLPTAMGLANADASAASAAAAAIVPLLKFAHCSLQNKTQNASHHNPPSLVRDRLFLFICMARAACRYSLRLSL